MGDPRNEAQGAVFGVLVGLSVSHLLNDLIQSLIAAVYPILKDAYALSFTQIGLITLAFQLTASLLQPLIGTFTDRRPQPFSLAAGMGFTLGGLLLLSVASDFPTILIAAALVGVGSSVFHPEASRVARVASGGTGSRSRCSRSAATPAPRWGRCWRRSSWCRPGRAASRGSRSPRCWRWSCSCESAGGTARTWRTGPGGGPALLPGHGLSRRRVALSLAILLCLVFSKHFYLASLTSYYTFYLIETFGVSVQAAQMYLFVFLGAVAAGTLLGGPVGDRLGFKTVIWISILGVLPFTLVLPHVNLVWTVVLTAPIGLILASAFSAIVVYAQELVPSRVGAVAGLFFGFAFGMGELGAAALGWMADHTGIGYMYRVCSFLPLIGLLTAFLPGLRRDG